MSDKVINFNPVFVTNQEINEQIDLVEYPLYLIIAIELIIIGFLFYFFFEQELIFIWNQFKPKNKEVNQGFIDLVNHLKSFTVECQNGSIILTSGIEVKTAQYFDGNNITFSTQDECTSFLNDIKNS